MRDLGLTALNPQSPIPNPQSIRGYRGGYLPAVRREIEAGLRTGQVRGVVATNALELGIDIGQLDAAVLAGYPGSIASTRQQMGRAGRRQGVSVAALIASAAPLDQYIITHPEYLLAGSPERGLLNPDNEIILAGHLACAAAELPLELAEVASGPAAGLLADLLVAGQLYRSGDRFYWAGEGNPTAAMSLRTSGADRIVIQSGDDEDRPVAIGEIDRESAPRLLYEGAVYLHEGATYLVERLDWAGGSARLRPVAVDFYTRPSSVEKVEVLAVRETGPIAAAGQVAWGDVRVISRATGYKIIQQATNAVLGFGEINLPEQVLETQACWLALSAELIGRLKAAGEWLSDPNDYGPAWPSQRDAARARDGFRCQGCGVVEAGGQQHDVHHRVPFRAFVADAALRGGLPVELAWQAANRLENLVTLCAACHRRAEAGVRLRSGLGGMAALVAGVAPLYLMCDPADLGMVVEPQDPQTRLPTITVYDRAPGGVGYAAQLYASLPDILQAGRELVLTCPCASGCPSCVGPMPEHEYALDTKALAAAVLRELVL